MARQLACRTAAMPLRPLASGRLRPGALRMDTQRLILLFIFGFSLLMLWEAWQKETRPKPAPSAPTAQQGVPTPQSAPATGPATVPQGVPNAGKPAPASSATVPGAAGAPVK